MNLRNISRFGLVIYFTAGNIFLTLSLFSQVKDKNIPVQQIYSLSGNQNDPKLTDFLSSPRKFSTEKIQALEELKRERENNDMSRQRRAEGMLERIDGRTAVTLREEHHAVIVQPSIKGKGKGNNEKDYLQHDINPFTNRAAGVAVVPPGAPNAGRIWVVSTQFGYAANDTMLYYFSDDRRCYMDSICQLVLCGLQCKLQGG